MITGSVSILNTVLYWLIDCQKKKKNIEGMDEIMFPFCMFVIWADASESIKMSMESFVLPL